MHDAAIPGMDRDFDRWLPRAGATLDQAPAAPRDLYERLCHASRLLHDMPPAPGRACLVYRDAEGHPARFLLPDDCTVGRAAPAELVIDSTHLSRRHFRVVHRDGVAEVEDLDSRNGTYVNGARMRRAVLRDGDVIEAGRVVLTYFAP